MSSICLITGIFPPEIGGPATYVSRLAHSLHQQGHQVCVVTQGEHDATVYPFPVQRISRNYPLPLRLLLLFATMLRYGWRSDIWYINGLEVPAVLAGKMLRKRLIMKIVGDYAWERAMNVGATTDMIDDFQRTKQGWKVEAHKRLRAWYTRQVHQVITPSQYLKTLVKGWGIPEQRITVIYNAVEEIPADVGQKQANRARFGLDGHAFWLITVCRLVAWKGVDHLLAILAQLPPHVHLLVIGDGPEKNRLTEFARTLSVTQRMKFIGKADRLDTLRYINAADAFVLNTGYEGFSHVLLEAMMVGTPVVTTPVCGNPELITHEKNGLLAPYGDTEVLMQQIQRLVADAELRAQLSTSGNVTVQLYSWQTLLQKTIEVLCGS